MANTRNLYLKSQGVAVPVICATFEQGCDSASDFLRSQRTRTQTDDSFKQQDFTAVEQFCDNSDQTPAEAAPPPIEVN